MSTDIADDIADPEGAATTGPADARTMMRFAIGVTLAFTLSQIFNWPVGFITPVFVILLLQAPRPLPFSAAAAFLVILASALVVGHMLGGFLAYMPTICVLLLVLAFCATFYWAQGGVSQLYVVLVLIGLTVMPVIGLQSLDVAAVAARGLLLSGFVAILLAWLMFGLMPNPEAAAPPPPAAKVPDPSDRFAAALVMTAIIAPLAIAFLFFGWTQLIVLIIPAIMVQQLSLTAGVKGGLVLIAANVVGGMVAIVIYQLLVAAPNFAMLLALMLLVSLVFAERIFSGLPVAGAWGSAFTATIIIVGGAVAPYGSEASAKLFDRLGQLILAVAYIGLAFALWQGLRGEIATADKDRSTAE